LSVDPKGYKNSFLTLSILERTGIGQNFADMITHDLQRLRLNRNTIRGILVKEETRAEDFARKKNIYNQQRRLEKIQTAKPIDVKQVNAVGPSCVLLDRFEELRIRENPQRLL
jgi:hypothetical protein